MNINILLISIPLQSTEKLYTYPFNFGFIELLNVKSFEIFPKHNGYGFISKSFALN